MNKNEQQHVQRAGGLNIVALALGVIFISTIAVLAQYLIFPKTYTFKTKPAGAKVYVNQTLRCEVTPCEVKLHTGAAYDIVFDKPLHTHHIIYLYPFNRKRIEAASMPISLVSSMDAKDRSETLNACRIEFDKTLKTTPEGAANFPAKPCYRLPPTVPWQANYSGHCIVTLDVDINGYPMNMRLSDCTEEIFEIPTRDAVQEWRYLPAYEDGVPVVHKNVQTRLSFRLKDHNGEILPEAPKPAEEPVDVH